MSERQDNDAAGWRLERGGEVIYVACDLLARIPGLAHGYSTRSGPAAGEDLDMGAAHASDPSVLARRRRFSTTVGLGHDHPVVLQQVHGDELVELVDSGPTAAPRADGLLARRGSASTRGLGVRTADCVALLLADDRGEVVAAVHAGWRGVAAGIAQKAVDRLVGLGARPSRLRAALGPAIGACCYAVGPEVREALAAASGVPEADLTRQLPDSRISVDLRRAIRAQLERSGLAAPSISAAPWCTACHPDLFFSYRRQGARAGRMMAIVGWRREGGGDRSGVPSLTEAAG